MHPDKVDRGKQKALTDLPNVGPAVARDLELIGIERPAQLRGRCPLELFRALCATTGQRHDPCVLDVFMSLTDFADGNPPRSWWAYTDERKSRYGRV